MVNETELKACEACGATIYPEHIHSGRAAVVEEKLLCPICVNEAKAATKMPLNASDEMVSVTLVEEEELDKTPRRVIKAFGSEKKDRMADTSLSRALQKTGTGATRVKVFHTKMNDGAVEFMVGQINEWVDHNPEVDIKIVQTTVGVWEGKHPEPHLILSVWY